jgi:hypothetical protein
MYTFDIDNATVISDLFIENQEAEYKEVVDLIDKLSKEKGSDHRFIIAGDSEKLANNSDFLTLLSKQFKSEYNITATKNLLTKISDDNLKVIDIDPADIGYYIEDISDAERLMALLSLQQVSDKFGITDMDIVDNKLYCKFIENRSKCLVYLKYGNSSEHEFIRLNDSLMLVKAKEDMPTAFFTSRTWKLVAKLNDNSALYFPTRPFKQEFTDNITTSNNIIKKMASSSEFNGLPLTHYSIPSAEYDNICSEICESEFISWKDSNNDLVAKGGKYACPLVKIARQDLDRYISEGLIEL